jgi:hypothetical protein
MGKNSPNLVTLVVGAIIRSIYGRLGTVEILEQLCWHWSCKYFLGKEHLVKNSPISTQDKVIYILLRNNFSGVNKTSLHLTKQVGDQLKKILPFFLLA